MSRRKGRYLRRQAKRKANLMKRNSAIGGLHEVFGYDDMYQAGKQCCKGVRWKNSTQRFEMHLFSGTAKRRKLLLAHKWKPCAYVHFVISERGKTRPIDAPRIQDTLKEYVLSLSDLEKISAVTYGMKLPKKYETTMNAKLAVAQAQMDAIIAKLGGQNDQA